MPLMTFLLCAIAATAHLFGAQSTLNSDILATKNIQNLLARLYLMTQYSEITEVALSGDKVLLIQQAERIEIAEEIISYREAASKALCEAGKTKKYYKIATELLCAQVINNWRAKGSLKTELRIGNFTLISIDDDVIKIKVPDDASTEDIDSILNCIRVELDAP